MTYAHAPLPQVKPAEYWCPTCRVPVASSLVRTVHTGGIDETIRNHRNTVIRNGIAEQLNHTVVKAQNRLAIR